MGYLAITLWSALPARERRPFVAEGVRVGNIPLSVSTASCRLPRADQDCCSRGSSYVGSRIHLPLPHESPISWTFPAPSGAGGVSCTGGLVLHWLPSGLHSHRLRGAFCCVLKGKKKQAGGVAGSRRYILRRFSSRNIHHQLSLRARCVHVEPQTLTGRQHTRVG